MQMSDIINEAKNPAFEDDKAIQKIDKYIKSNSNRVDNAELSSMIQRIVKKYEPLIKETKFEFNAFLNSVSRKYNAKVVTDTKSMKSILDKAIKRSYGFGNIQDLVRGSLLFKTNDDVDKFVKNFVRKNNNVIVDWHKKERGQDPDLGYFGSYHFSLVINGLVTELQVMTSKLYQYKDEAHKIYTQTRSTGGPDKFQSHMSKKMFSLASKKSNESIDLIFDEDELRDMY
jgi:hypothetical protein